MMRVLKAPHLPRPAITALLLFVRAVAALLVLVPLLATPSVASISLACAAVVMLAGSVVRWVFLLLMEEFRPLAPAPGLRVAAVTSFVPGAESLPMLERTLTAMVGMSYEHDTWLLDEGNDDGAARLGQRLGVKHWSRKDKSEYQTESGVFQRRMKHGNYNAWLHEIGFGRYDVLAAFDPDHVPDPDYLDEMLGQLNSGIAYVQSPQDYYNLRASLIARGCSEESRDFYWITQRAYHRFGAPSVIGAHGVHRLDALKEVGGLAPHLADDLLLTLRYQMSRRAGAYVPKVLARGLAPVDWPAYVKQQRRWARSLFDVKLRLFPQMTSHLPLRARVVGLLQGLTYLQDAVAAICCVVAVCSILAYGAPASLVATFEQPGFAAGIALLLITGLYPHLFHGPYRNLGFYWRAGCLRSVKWPYTVLALIDVIRNRDRGYELTGKDDAPTRVDWMLYWPHVLTCVLVAAAWAFGASDDVTQGALPTVLSTLVLFPSLLLLVSGFFRAPAAFDPALANESRDERE
jgi:cellulose synthase (UDP-forming)